MSKPMPSPKGTNHERLFMKGAGAAYDAALTDEKRASLREFLGSKLDPADLEAVDRILDEEDAPAEVEAPPEAAAEDTASYRLKTRQLYEAGHLTMSEFSRRMEAGPPRAVTASDARAVAKMFPNADRLKR